MCYLVSMKISFYHVHLCIKLHISVHEWMSSSMIYLNFIYACNYNQNTITYYELMQVIWFYASINDAKNKMMWENKEGGIEYTKMFSQLDSE